MQKGQFLNAATFNSERNPAPPLGIGPMGQALQEASPVLLAMSKGLLSGQGAGAYMSDGIEAMNRNRAAVEQNKRQDALSDRINARLDYPVAASSRNRGVGQPVVPMTRTPAQTIGDAAMAAIGKPGAMSLPGIFESLEQQHGLPAGYLTRTAQIESGMNPNAQNPNSSAGGMFQFIDSTAQQYGLANKNNPHASAQAAAQLAADNAAYLRRVLGREPTAAELYLAHQQGAGGAAKLLSNPNANAASIVGDQAVALNAGNAGMTAGEFTNQWLGKFNGGQNPNHVQVAQAGGNQNEILALLADPNITPGQRQALALKYEQEMQARQQPKLSIQELADGRKYYVDQSGQKDPRLVAPNMALPPDEMDFGRFKVVGNQLYDLAAEGGPTVVGQSRQTPGFSVTMPDGTTVTHGWQGDVPPGQNDQSTGTPRDPGKLSSELSKKDAAALEEINAAGRTATDIESLAAQLETVAPQVGYTGPGGQIYGAVDDAIGVLPGDSGARGAFKSLAMEAQLTFTEKTKGAITDREMGMFRAAVPNLGQTQEGNMAIAQVMKASAARVQTRAAFFENWARKHGSLEGAQEVWSEYMRDNPLIAEDGSSIKANPEGDWQSYLNHQPAMSYTPERILRMDQAGLANVPIEKLTGPQLDALERRMLELSQ